MTKAHTRARTSRRRATRKFMDGKMTPQEFHRQNAFPLDAKCAGCGDPPAVKAMIFAELAEATKRGLVPPVAFNGQLNDALMATIVKFKGPSGPVAHTRLSQAYACTRCRPAFERQLAKSPSWCVVEICEGPDPRNRVAVGYAS